MTADHRYHRQQILPCIGESGQHHLSRRVALIIGCGALGGVVIDTLARAGVGTLVLVDRDFVERTNLQRQVLFDDRQAAEHTPKVQAALERVQAVNPDVRVIPQADDFRAANAETIALRAADRPVDIVVDGTDNFQTRLVINDLAVKHGIPFVYGGVVGTAGTWMTVLPRTPEHDSPWEAAGRVTPCLKCLFDEAPAPGMTATCDTAGVFSPAVSIVASHQASTALKILVGDWAAVPDTLGQIDLWANTQRALRLPERVLGCACCGDRRFPHLDARAASNLTTLCGSDAVQLLPEQTAGQVALQPVAEQLSTHGEVKLNRFMLRGTVQERGKPYEITLFPDGRTIIRGTRDPVEARAIYARYIGG